eukprot:jgi/Galph1/551/GphlegSOOS_G5355.1
MAFAVFNWLPLKNNLFTHKKHTVPTIKRRKSQLVSRSIYLSVGDSEAKKAAEEHFEPASATPNQLWSHFTKDKGNPDCKQCNGTGVIPCPACEGQGYFVMEIFSVTSSNQCQLCRGHRVAPCPLCKEHVYRAINWWDKAGKENDPTLREGATTVANVIDRMLEDQNNK